MPWADPSASRNLVTNLLIVPANVTQRCSQSAAAAPELSSTVVVEAAELTQGALRPVAAGDTRAVAIQISSLSTRDSGSSQNRL